VRGPGLLLAIFAVCGFGQVSPAEPHFEADDVHASGPALNPFTWVSGGGLRGERYDLRKATLLDLIRIAYQVDPEKIVGGPNWLEFDRFDIAGRAPAETSPETVRRMVQSLLAERFHLVVHTEMRPMPTYVLSLSQGKPKLAQATGDGDAECRWASQPAGSSSITLLCRNISMTSFAERLRGAAGDYVKEPVIDRTGLEGKWDLSLEWNPRSQALPESAQRITVSDAVERDLGLSFALRQEPAPVLAIDQAEKPTPNGIDVAQKLPPREKAFEVATVKLNKTPQVLPFRVTRGGLRIPSAPLMTVLGFAWDMNTVHTTQRFIGLPKGIESIDVAIDARTTKDTNASGLDAAAEVDDDLREMTRALLTERFQMKWRVEDRLMEGYSLLSAKPKLKPADPSNRAGCHEARSMANDPRDTNAWLTTVLSCRNVTLAQFASTLQKFDNRQFAYPVEDITGIDGTFDFDLSFTQANMMERPEAVQGGAISLSEAISRQLGLRLEKRKRMLPAVVIDHMSLTPTEN
jgi:uncharacterized protein (TIGR03435 family)